LQGRGIALEFGNGDKRVLRSTGDWMEFDGGIPTRCQLLDGPCVDLNLVVSKSLRTAVRVERLREVKRVAAIQGETTLIFGIQTPLCLESRGESTGLEPWDLAILTDCSAQLSGMAPADDSAQSTVFIATISP
jgi:environmental stress-induced protein Ves